MIYNELLENVKGLLRPRVELKMRLPSTQAIREFLNVQDDDPKFQDRQALANGTAFLFTNAVDRCITSIMALGYNESLDAAVQDMIETVGTGLGGFVESDEDVIRSYTHELGLYLDAFGPEIDLFKRMHKLSKSGLSIQEVWDQIRDTP